MNRRDILTAFAGATLASGCSARPPWPGSVGTARAGVALVDIHCHIFNGRDLPTVRFLKQVFFKFHPANGIRTLDIEDEDIVDGLLAVLVFVVGSARAPTAQQEISVLDASQAADPRNGNGEENDTAVINALAQLVADDAIGVSGDIRPGAYVAIRRSILQAAGLVVPDPGEGVAVTAEELSEEEARLIARRAYESPFDIGLLFRWFALFTRYRYALADELVRFHAAQAQPGFTPKLLCPALIDYDFWLDEYVDESPLPDQVTVMGRLARRREGAVVHGYAPFDPLRQARWDFEQSPAGRISQPRAAFDPLALVTRAVEEEGFIGVKIYPPMGFRASGNAAAVCQLYPRRVVEDFGPASTDPRTEVCLPDDDHEERKRPMDGSVALSERLDSAMNRLFETCSRLDVGILAHAGNSVESGADYGERADPAFWLPVFRRWPGMRVMLAHFGGFSSRSDAAPRGALLPEASWEWTFGRFIKEHDPSVFFDLSYFTEIAHRTPEETSAYAEIMKRWISEFDPDCRHLAFGTDWIMVGLDDGYAGYTARCYAFLAGPCGLDAERLDRIFSRNAGRFAGLRRGDRTLARLEDFYTTHGVPLGRLPVFEI